MLANFQPFTGADDVMLWRHVSHSVELFLVSIRSRKSISSSSERGCTIEDPENVMYSIIPVYHFSTVVYGYIVATIYPYIYQKF